MALLGFPEKMSEYEPKHYLRLAIIILGYIVLRPHIANFFQRQHEKAREAEKKKSDPRALSSEERKKLEGKPSADETGASKGESSSSSWGWGSKSKKRGAPEKPVEKPDELKTKEDFVAQMDSDEDVSDLLS